MIQLRPVALEIDKMLDTQLNPGPAHVRERMVLNALIAELEATGRLLSVEGMPVHLFPDGTILDITSGDEDLIGFISSCGLQAGGRYSWDAKLSDALRGQRLPLTRKYGLAHYDLPSHVLFLNEWNNHFVRVDPDGKASRHVNGEFDLLFEKADAPHDTDLEQVNTYTGGALAWTDTDALVEHVYGVAVYSETSGIGRANAVSVLLGFTLALVMSKRVKAVPVVFMGGQSGTRKSAVSQALGWVVSGAGMKFCVTSCPDSAGAVENCLINAHGLICLDEFQNAKQLATLIKSVTTGGTIKRRVLFTTSSEKSFTVDASLVLTVNGSPFLDDATTKRFLKINMGTPDQDKSGWRGDVFVESDWLTNNLRERCWNELVCRLSAAMRLLTQAAAAGEADIRVHHRMSGFWSFLLAIAKQEGPDVLARTQATLDAIGDEQTISLGTQDDVLPRLLDFFSVKPDFCRRWIGAAELGSAILRHWSIGSHFDDGPNQFMKKLLSSPGQLSARLSGSPLYKEQLGLQTSVDTHKKVKTFWFDPPADPDVKKKSHGCRTAGDL